MYASIDWSKGKELNELLEVSLNDKIEFYREQFHNLIQKMFELHKKIVPNSKIVMGEGLTYCCSPTLTFERDSERFWQLINEQMKYFKDKDLWGSVIATTHAPERTAAWGPCKDLYLEANKLFLNKD